MKIVSLAPEITELLQRFEKTELLAGRTSLCRLNDLPAEQVVSLAHPGESRLNRVPISDFQIDFEELQRLQPDLILSTLYSAELDQGRVNELEAELRDELKYDVKLRIYAPRTMDGVYDFFESVGKDCGESDKGRQLAQRLKAQVMNWCDNFYERMKNKKVTFISGVNPYKLAGLWVPDMIKLCSAVPQFPGDRRFDRETTWSEIQEFRPDVLLVAPRGMELDSAKRLFMDFEKEPGWEELSAVKRGDVFFTSGARNFYRPTGALFDSMGILVSAIAGFDSGYITERDTFFRLRYLEMHRHTL